MRTAQQNQAIADAAIYALKSGCFFPAPPLEGKDSVQTMIRKGALRHLHDVLAVELRADGPKEQP
jgi:hypothetical protein